MTVTYWYCPKCGARFEDDGKPHPSLMLCAACPGAMKGVLQPVYDDSPLQACPFCGEGDFDLIGLKVHLQQFCDEFDALPVQR